LVELKDYELWFGLIWFKDFVALIWNNVIAFCLCWQGIIFRYEHRLLTLVTYL